jgi:3-phosphoshikimate 1-carboxyvinyltransferase
MVSKPYIATTVDVMRSFGARCEVDEHVRKIKVPGGQRYVGRDYRVERDATAASYFLAAAAVTGGRIRIPGLGAASNQGDIAFVEVLERMGCAVSRSEREIVVEGPRSLGGVDADFSDIPDTFMTLAAIAPLAAGPVTIRGIAPTRAKESNRPAAMAAELRKLGASVEESDDVLVIHPGVRGDAVVDTYDDHRIAMSFAVLGLRAPGVSIANPGCVGKTFPRFFERLEELAGPARLPAPA